MEANQRPTLNNQQLLGAKMAAEDICDVRQEEQINRNDKKEFTTKKNTAMQIMM